MNSRFGRIWLAFGYAFLYIPIATLIVFSFNESKMVTLWSGFSLHWYGEIVHDAELINGFVTSLKIALLTASASIVLGTLAAFALVRYRNFVGRTAFIAHINAPLVVPEVITGLSLLLFFVACARLFGIFSERGIVTIWIGHTSICTCYAAVVIQSRLLGMDKSLEEAAMNLGCRPFQVFMLVTLPMIAQSLVSAWLLTFTISLDDVVTSSFLNGPGVSTLPIVIFARARLGLNPTVNAVATLSVAVVSIGVLTGSLWMARNERRRAQEQAAAYREGMLKIGQRASTLAPALRQAGGVSSGALT
jgi:putrescine transport system permease protein